MARQEVRYNRVPATPRLPCNSREHAGAVQSVHTATESADDLTQGVDAEPLPQMPFCRGPQVPSAASAPVRELGVLEAEVQRLKTRLVDREEELAALSEQLADVSATGDVGEEERDCIKVSSN